MTGSAAAASACTADVDGGTRTFDADSVQVHPHHLHNSRDHGSGVKVAGKLFRPDCAAQKMSVPQVGHAHYRFC